MPARTTGRAKFDFRGRPFVWWVDGDRYLRIASLDKKFVIAFPLGRVPEDPPTIEVIGSEFPGLDPSEARPLWLVVPEPSYDSMGGMVDELLRWSFDSEQQRIRFDGPPRWC